MIFLTAFESRHATRTLVLCGVVLLAACGQKGPLYLPEETPQSMPFSACDAADALCRQQGAQTPAADPIPSSLPESSTAPGAISTESTAP